MVTGGIKFAGLPKGARQTRGPSVKKFYSLPAEMQ